MKFFCLIFSLRLENCCKKVFFTKINFPNRNTEKNNLFEGVLYQYFEGLYYERYHRRNINISITILFVRGEREKAKIKQTF
jgi:hypothetical protein